ncbi:MAG: sigma-70 family RNA polymerase sigma factor [Acidobacteriota bacterium]
MSKLSDPAQYLADNLSLIRQIVRSVARRQRLRGALVDELESTVWLHLVERDYRALRQYQGRASFSTFITVVVTRQAQDLRCAELGRWRPSNRARRGGADAVRFETMVYRDGWAPATARAKLEAEGHALAETVEQEITSRARSRPRRFVAIESVTGQMIAVDSAKSTPALDHHDQVIALRSALGRALRGLRAEDRLLLRLRHHGGFKVSQISRALGHDQKALYRRLDALHRTLRETLERSGVSAHDARARLSL